VSLHYLDPDREPRECPGCPGCAPDAFFTPETPDDCHGTGRLGVEGARADVEILHHTARTPVVLGPEEGWFYQTTRGGIDPENEDPDVWLPTWEQRSA
jgi:hypothetical protein